MAVLGQDAFTESSNTALDAHTPDVGAGWTLEAAQFTAMASTDDVRHNVSALQRAKKGDDVGDDTMVVTARVKVGNSASRAAGVCARMGSGFADQYEAHLLRNSATQQDVMLFKNVGGTRTQLGSTATITLASDTYIQLKLSVGTGTQQVSVFASGWTLLISTTEPDSTLAGRQFGGIIMNGNNQVVTGVDDFLVESVDAPVSITPGAGALVAAGFAPSIQAGGGTFRTPAPGALVAAGLAPTLRLDTRLTPPAGAVSVTGAAPSVQSGANTFRTPGAGALTAAGLAPTVAIDVRLRPGVGALTATGQVPTRLTSGASATRTPGAGGVAITGLTPSIVVTSTLTPSREIATVWLVELAAIEWYFCSIDLDALAVQYLGELLNEPVVSRSLTDVQWGQVQVQDVTVVLSNANGALTARYLADLAGLSMVLKRYDRVSGTTTVEWTGVVAVAALSRDALELRGTNLDRSALEDTVPKGLIDTVAFPGATDAVGVPAPWLFGNHRNRPVLSVRDDQENDLYDYLICRDAAAAITGARRVGSGGATFEIEFDELEPYPGQDGTLVNGNMESYDAGASAAPDSWIVSGTGASAIKNITAGQVDQGNASVSLTRTVNDASLTQDLVPNAPLLPLSWWRGREVFITIRARAVTAAQARFRVSDGVVSTTSYLHTGGGAFETLVLGTLVAPLSFTIDPAATQFAIECQVIGTNGTAQFDNVRVYFKPKSWEEVLRPDLYPGYTALRFVERQVDSAGALYTVAVDVKGLQPERNLIRAARTILSHPSSGLNRPVSAESFDAMEAATCLTYDAAVLLDGPELFLTFQDSVDNFSAQTMTIRDRSGHERHGVYDRGAAPDLTLYGGGAAGGPGTEASDSSDTYFDAQYGFNDWVAVPGNAAFSGQSISAECWLWIPDGSLPDATAYPIVEKLVGAGQLTGYGFYRQNNMIVWFVRGADTNLYTLTTPIAPADEGRWIHLVGTAAAGVLQIYRGNNDRLIPQFSVPTVLVATGSYSGLIAEGDGVVLVAKFGTPVTMGRDGYDCIALYSHELSAARIAHHYTMATTQDVDPVSLYDKEVIALSPTFSYWLTEPSGVTMGPLNAGTFVGAPTMGVPGPLTHERTFLNYGGAVRFSNNVAQYGVKTGLTLADTNAWAGVWYKPAALGVNAGIIEKTIGGVRNTQWGLCQLRVGTTSVIRYTRVTTAGTYTLDTPLTAEDVDRWMWLSLRWQNAGFRMRLFKNGVMVGDGAYAGTAVSGVGDFYVGVQGTAGLGKTRPGQGDIGRVSYAPGPFLAGDATRLWTAATWYPGGLFVDAALDTPLQAMDWLSQVFQMCGVRLGVDANGAFTIAADVTMPVSVLALRDGEGDGSVRNLLDCRNRHRPALVDRVKNLRFKYRYDALSQEYLGEQVVAVSSTGRDWPIESRVVREDVTAQRVAQYLGARMADDETVEVEFVQAADEQVLEGDAVDLTDAAVAYAADNMEVLSVDIELDAARAVLGELTAARYTYTPSALAIGSRPE